MPTALQDLLRPPAGMEIDFTAPKGEPALAAADSVSWRIFRNPVALFIGGVSAVILELAEPSVRAGVWDHSSFRKDPLNRLRRTGYAAMVTVYGPRSAAEAMIAHVVRMHDRVEGKTDAGTPYRANDPRLLNWVQATATFGFVEAYSRYVSRLSDDEKSAAFREAAVSARLYGATGAPESWQGWQAMLARTAADLEGSPILTEFLDIMETAPIMPTGARWMQRLLVRAAVEMVPDPVRSLPELTGRGLRSGEALLVRGLAKLAGIARSEALPPQQAEKRLRGS